MYTHACLHACIHVYLYTHITSSFTWVNVNGICILTPDFIFMRISMNRVLWLWKDRAKGGTEKETPQGGEGWVLANNQRGEKKRKRTGGWGVSASHQPAPTRPLSLRGKRFLSLENAVAADICIALAQRCLPRRDLFHRVAHRCCAREACGRCRRGQSQVARRRILWRCAFTYTHKTYEFDVYIERASAWCCRDFLFFLLFYFCADEGRVKLHEDEFYKGTRVYMYINIYIFMYLMYV